VEECIEAVSSPLCAEKRPQRVHQLNLATADLAYIAFRIYPAGIVGDIKFYQQPCIVLGKTRSYQHGPPFRFGQRLGDDTAAGQKANGGGDVIWRVAPRTLSVDDSEFCVTVIQQQFG